MERKKRDESRVVEAMLDIYCHKNSHERNIEPKNRHTFPLGNKKSRTTRVLCETCQKLLDYCGKKINTCPLGVHKGTCQLCSIHCYNPTMREKIKAVMRFSGPHMIYLHPIMTTKHLLLVLKEKLGKGKISRVGDQK